MKTPYELLNVTADAGDAEIKRAYLQKVKDNPPERNPELFQTFHNAYEAIKDHKTRINYALFHTPVANFDPLLDRAFDTEQTLTLNPDQFEKLLQTGIDKQNLSDTMLHSNRK